MSTLEQLQHGLERAWSGINEGWEYLVRKASHALTRFNPPVSNSNVETASEQLLQHTARWSVLAAEVTETDDSLQVRLEVPGMERNDFDIDVVDDILVVRGEKHLEQEHRDSRYHVMECAYGQFERAIPLPMSVQSDKARASYRRGVLSIELPKQAGSRRRRITVETE